METGILSPKDLFQKGVRYTVPTFQRSYVWTQEEQWEPLWEDVQNIAEDYLEKLEEARGDAVQAEQNTLRHFLGAVVIKQVNTASKDIEQREVIDGQQRLTTLQLLLDAIQYVYESHDLKPVARRLSKLVTNDRDLVEDSDHAFKLWPTKSDREAFRHAMHNELETENYKSSKIVQAHEYFQLQARQWLEVDGELNSTRAEALEAAVTGMLRMVVIDLGSLDDPHVIFETLNARGTPLLESDLIKNFVLAESVDNVEDDVWGHLEDDWWREDVKQGRLFRPRIDALLDYWLEMRTAEDVTAGRLFLEFKRETDGKSIDSVMSQLRDDLGKYRQYEDGHRNVAEDMFHYRSSVMQMGAFTPVLISVLSKPERVRLGVLKVLESFLIRRMICRATTKDYNRMALDLVRELHGNTPEESYSVVVEFLRGQTAESRQWPTDRELIDAMTALPLYRLLTRGRLRLVLEAIEGHYRATTQAEQTEVPRNLTIEHVLPVGWQTHWPLSVNGNDEERSHKRNTLLHTIGNLTLVTNRLNASASNGPWERKRKTLDEHSVLMLNRVLLAESIDIEWDEEFILDRSTRLADIVSDVWPGADSTVWNKDT